ncbi:MAG: Tyrosine recombinase XerC [Desulfovibrio sp.]
MATNQWKTDGMPKGVRYYEHPTRMRSKHSKQPDRCFGIKYRFMDKTYADTFGWESEGWEPDIVAGKMREYRENRVKGASPVSWKEERSQDYAKVQEIKGNTFAALFAALMEIKKVSTSVRRQNDVNYSFRTWINPIIGNIPISELKDTDIAKVVSTMQAGVPPKRPLEPGEKPLRPFPRSPQTIRHIYNMIRMVWLYADRNGLTTARVFPGKGVLPADPDNQRQFFFTREQANAVLADLLGFTVEQHEQHKRNEAERQALGLSPEAYREKKGIELPALPPLKGTGGRRGSLDAYGLAIMALYCGLRAGEILGLTWQDISLKKVFETKDRKKSRILYVDIPEVKEMLEQRRALISHRPEDLVFPSADGSQLGEIPDVFQRSFVRCGINLKGEKNRKKKAVFHSFRHTFGTWHAMNGVPLTYIAAMMGHSIQKTTERYAAHCPEDAVFAAAMSISAAKELPAAEEVIDADFVEVSKSSIDA